MCPSGMARHGERSISMENQAVSGTKKPLFGGRKPLFTQKELLLLTGPLLVEQLLEVTVGMADTMMVSRCGEAAISGVSLVDMINNLIIVLFAALATGGAVVVSQFLGAREQKEADASSGQLLLLSGVFGLLVGAFCFVFASRVEELMDTIEDTIRDLKALFNNAPDLAGTIRKYIEENAGLKKQMEDFMREKEAQIKERLLKNMQEIHGIKVIKICAPIPAESIKNIAFQLRGEITENLCFVAGTINEGKPMLTVMLSDNLVAGGLKAGNLVKEAAKLIQGGGGGQPHFATAGGKNVDGLNAAIEKVLELAGI